MNIKPLNMIESNHPVSEDRMNRLRQASEKTKKDMEDIEAKINTMSEDELNEAMQYAMEDPEIDYYTNIGGDGYNQSPVFNNNSRIVNYNDTPQNSIITYDTTQQQSIQTYNTNNIYNNQYQSMYSDKYRFYNMNPNYYFDVQEMEDHFNALEKERKSINDKQLCLALLSAKLGFILRNDQEEYDLMKKQIEEMYKFVPAEEIMRKRREEEQKIYEQRQKSMDIFNNGYEYNERGIRKERAFIVTVTEINSETGEEKVIFDNSDDLLVDEDGNPVVYHTLLSDRQEMMENINIDKSINDSKIREVMIGNFIRDRYNRIQTQHEIWRAEGKNVNQEQFKSEIDYKSHERRLRRFLSTVGYSKDRFDELLHLCCNTDLNYNNTTDVFRMSYDMARDLHLANMIKTPEELAMDKKFTDRLKQEYDIKRSIFLNRIDSGNIKCDTSFNGRASSTILPKPNIDNMTLEDHFRPENMTPYAKIECPMYETENAYVGKMSPQDALRELESTMNPEDFAELSKHFDANGNVVPNPSTMTIHRNIELSPEEQEIIDNGIEVVDVYDKNGNLITVIDPTNNFEGCDLDTPLTLKDTKFIDTNSCSLEELEDLGF